MPTGAVNNVNVQPDGSTTFRELDLPSGDSDTPANQSRIRWVKLSDGSVVAEIFATDYSFPTFPQVTVLQANVNSQGARGAQLNVRAQGQAANDYASLVVTSDTFPISPGPGITRGGIYARASTLATNFSQKFMDEDGNSDFLAGVSLGPFTGAWQTSVPGPTTGVAFNVPSNGIYLCQAYCSNFAVVANTLNIVEVYMNGVKKGNMQCFANQAALHMPNLPFTWIQPLFAANPLNGAAITNYVGFRTTSGDSNNGDFGQFFCVKIGLQ